MTTSTSYPVREFSSKSKYSNTEDSLHNSVGMEPPMKLSSKSKRVNDVNDYVGMEHEQVRSSSARVLKQFAIPIDLRQASLRYYPAICCVQD